MFNGKWYTNNGKGNSVTKNVLINGRMMQMAPPRFLALSQDVNPEV